MDPNRSALPAMLGGQPVRPEGPPAWPMPDPEVRRMLEAAYADGSWGMYRGNYVARLEAELAAYHATGFALTCASGTFAVQLALNALRVGPDDEVILAAYDYSGNFLSVLALGARPVLVDPARENWNMGLDQLEPAISPKTRAVIATHLHGGLVPIRELVAVAHRHGVPVVEDAAQMPGARIEGRKAGTWGDVGVISFGGSKLLTAGRGGAILTADRAIHHHARLHCQRGNHVNPLSELQAAVLLPQLAQLDARNAARTQNVQLLDQLLAGLPGLERLRNHLPDSAPGYYKVGYQFIPAEFGGLSRDCFVEAARAEGIAFDAGFRSLHVGRSASRYRCVGSLAEAERAHHSMLVLHHPVLLGSASDVEQVAQAVRKLYEHRLALSRLSELSR